MMFYWYIIDSSTVVPTDTSVSLNRSAPRNDFQMDSVGASSTVNAYTKSEVTTSFDLYPTTSTFKPDPESAVSQQADDKLVMNGPPPYSTLYK